MKTLIGFTILNLILITAFQNCARNQAVHFDSVKVNSVEATVDDNQAMNLPPLQSYKSCTMPNGTVVPHLYVTWNLKNAANGITCDLFEVRQCFDGIMNPTSGSYTKEHCDIDPMGVVAGKAPCSIDGTSVAHGQIVFAYNTRLATGSNNCVAQIRRCNNGTLTGNNDYSNLTCGESFYKPPNGQAYDCTLNNLKIPDGTISIAFKEDTPAESCLFEPRRCIQGRLSGTFTKLGCTPKPK